MLKLYIGNKNYSSWSMRPWVLLRQAGIAFEEIAVRFDAFTPGSAFKKTMLALSPAGKVPVLVDTKFAAVCAAPNAALPGTGLAVADTLAIAEYLAEQFIEKKLWPDNLRARAQGRSACAEMHAGFTALRTHCPMNIEAALADAGARVWRDQPAVRADVARLTDLWRSLLAEHQGPMLLGEFSVADAYFAPVCMRLRGYSLPVPDDVAAYIERVHKLAAVQQWIAQALAEKDFLDFEEPYRLNR